MEETPGEIYSYEWLEGKQKVGKGGEGQVRRYKGEIHKQRLATSFKRLLYWQFFFQASTYTNFTLRFRSCCCRSWRAPSGVLLRQRRISSCLVYVRVYAFMCACVCVVHRARALTQMSKSSPDNRFSFFYPIEINPNKRMEERKGQTKRKCDIKWRSLNVAFRLASPITTDLKGAGEGGEGEEREKRKRELVFLDKRQDEKREYEPHDRSSSPSPGDFTWRITSPSFPAFLSSPSFRLAIELACVATRFYISIGTQQLSPLWHARVWLARKNLITITQSGGIN